MSFLDRSANKFSPKRRQQSPHKRMGSASQTLFSDLSDFRSGVKRKYEQNSPSRNITSKIPERVPTLQTSSSNVGLNQLQRDLQEISHSRNLKFKNILSPTSRRAVPFASTAAPLGGNLNSSFLERSGALNTGRNRTQQSHLDRSAFGLGGGAYDLQSKFSQQYQRQSQVNVSSLQRQVFSPFSRRQSSPSKLRGLSPLRSELVRNSPKRHSPARRISPTIRRVSPGKSSGLVQPLRSSPQREYIKQKIRSISPRRNKTASGGFGGLNTSTSNFLSQQQLQFRENLSNLQNSRLNYSQSGLAGFGTGVGVRLSSSHNNVSSLLEDTRLQAGRGQQGLTRSYKEQVRLRGIDGIVPQYKIQELQDVLVDASDAEFNDLPRQYIEDLVKLSSVIMFRVKSSSYYKRTL